MPAIAWFNDTAKVTAFIPVVLSEMLFDGFLGFTSRFPTLDFSFEELKGVKIVGKAATEKVRDRVTEIRNLKVRIL